MIYKDNNTENNLLALFNIQNTHKQNKALNIK